MPSFPFPCILHSYQNYYVFISTNSNTLENKYKAETQNLMNHSKMYENHIEMELNPNEAWNASKLKFPNFSRSKTSINYVVNSWTTMITDFHRQWQLGRSNGQPQQQTLIDSDSSDGWTTTTTDFDRQWQLGRDGQPQQQTLIDSDQLGRMDNHNNRL